MLALLSTCAAYLHADCFRLQRTLRFALGVGALGFALALTSGAPLEGQSREGQARPIRFERVGEGLPQQTVLALAQDETGYLWVGTQNGLARWDGERFVVHVHDPADPNSLSESNVWAIEPISGDDLWIGTDGAGVDRWIALEQRFEHVLPAASLPDGSVRALVRDGSRLWVGTRAGLVRYDPSPDGEPVVTPIAIGDRDPGSAPLTRGVRALELDANGTLWIGTEAAGLYRLEAGETEALGVSLDDGSGLPEPSSPWALYAHRDGQIWVGTESGVLRVDSGSSRVRRDLRATGGQPQIVRSLRVDDHERLWVATEGGLFLADAADGPSTLYAESSEDGSLVNSRVLTLFEDRSGLLWIGTQAGLQRFDRRSWSFGLVSHRPGDSESLGSNIVTSFSEAPDGSLWVGTMRAGIDRIDPVTGVFEHYRAGSGPGALRDNRVMSLHHGRDGTLWVGTYGGGLASRRVGADGFEIARHDPDDPDSLAGDAVSSILEDSRGDLWVGTFGAGVDRLDPDTGRFHHYSTATGDLGSDDVVALAEGPDGAIWVGTHLGGLHHYRRDADAFVRITPESGRTESLSATSVFSLTFAPDGVLWVGTDDAGVDRLRTFDPVTGLASFDNLSTADGLPNNVVYGIEAGVDGRMWLSTNAGLAAVDDQDRVQVFTRRDGLQGDEFNSGAHLALRDGRLAFGGFEGFNLFHPERIERSDFEPPVVMVEIRKVDRPLETDRPIDKLEELVLDHRDQVVSFEVAALDFTAIDDNQLRFQLIGFDPAMRPLDGERRITYTNLDAGRYELHVIAANPHGVWNEEGLRLPIRVLPAPWKTWWAYTAYGVLGLALVGGTIRWRLRELREREQVLTRQVGERTRDLSAAVDQLRLSETEAQQARQEAVRANRAKTTFLSSMSHELRTPLGAVLGFSQLLLRDPQLDVRQRRLLGTIESSGEHLLGLINEVLSLAKIEAGKMQLDDEIFDPSDLLRTTLAMIQVRAEKTGLQLVDEATHSDFPSRVRGDESRLRQVLLNLLGNAIKFTPRGGRVSLRAHWTGGRGFFEVDDTGAGIAEHELPRLFEPFEQTLSGRESGEGTGLGLAISRDIVRLMGGDITVRSTEGVGSTFRFSVAMPAESDSAQIRTRRDRRIARLAPGQPTVRVLVVDDQEETRQLFSELLRDVDIEVKLAADGAEAIETWRFTQPDAVLMDLNMPVVSGVEAIQALRTEEEARGRSQPTVVIATTATVFEHDRERLLEIGADDLLNKPFRDLELFELLEQHLGVRFLEVGAADDLAPGEPVTVTDAARLPADLRRELIDALLVGDVAKALVVLERHPDVDSRSADVFARRLRRFEVAHLLDVLERSLPRSPMAPEIDSPASEPDDDSTDPDRSPS